MLRRLNSSSAGVITSPQRDRSAAVIAASTFISPQRGVATTTGDDQTQHAIVGDDSSSQARGGQHLWRSPAPSRTMAFSSMCFDAASRVLPGRGVRSPTTESSHAAVAAPFLRAHSFSPTSRTSHCAAESATRPLAASRVHELLLAMQQEQPEEPSPPAVDQQETVLEVQQQQQQQQSHAGSPSYHSAAGFSAAGVGGGGGGGISTSSSRAAATIQSSSAAAAAAGSPRNMLADAAKRRRDIQTTTRPIAPASVARTLPSPSSTKGKKQKVKKTMQEQQQQSHRRPTTSSSSSSRIAPKRGADARIIAPGSSTVSQQQQQQQQRLEQATGGGDGPADTSSSLEKNGAKSVPVGFALHSVPWREWGPAALLSAAAENKLLFIRVTDSRSHFAGGVIHRDARIASASSHLLLANSFVPVSVDWAQDPELAATYHAFAGDQLLRNLDRNIAIRTDSLVSVPESPACFDVVALPDGRPVFANGRHLSDSTAHLPSFGIFDNSSSSRSGSAEDGDDLASASAAAFSVPMTEMALILDQYSKLWARPGGAAHVRQQAKALQDDQSKPRAEPRTTMSVAHAHKVVLSAVEDFHFLLDCEAAPDALSWREVASSEGASLLEGSVQLLIDAQFAFRRAVASAASHSPPHHQHHHKRCEEARGQLAQLNSAVEKAAIILTNDQIRNRNNNDENVADHDDDDAGSDLLAHEVLSLEALAVGAQLEMLLGQEAAKTVDPTTSTMTATATTTVWIRSLRKRLATMQLASASSTIPRSQASSADLVKIVRSLAISATILAPAALHSGDNSNDGNGVGSHAKNELRASLRLAVWTVSLLFQRAATSSPLLPLPGSEQGQQQQPMSRTQCIDLVHAWSALVEMMRVVGFDGAMSSQVLASSCAGMVSATAPLRRAWDERVKVTVERQWAQRSVPNRSAARGTRTNNMSLRTQDEISNVFSARAATKRSEEMAAARSANSITGNGGRFAKEDYRNINNNNNNNSSFRRGNRLASMMPVTTSFSTKSWFSFPPMINEEVDLDDARVLSLKKRSSGNNSGNDEKGNVDPSYSHQHPPAVVTGMVSFATGSHLTPSTNKNRSEAAQLLTNMDDGPLDLIGGSRERSATEREWAMKMSRNLGVPVEQRQKCPPSSNLRAESKGKAKQSSSSSSSPFAEDSDPTAADSSCSSCDAASLWRASNAVWAGAPRVDRGGTIAAALRTVDTLQHVLAPAHRDSHTFSAMLFSLRQIAAVVLTSNSARRGDCLATQGQLAGTVLKASTPSTFLVSCNNISSNKNDNKFTLADFGGNGATTRASVDLDATVGKFIAFLQSNRDLCLAAADTACLSLYSHVTPLSVQSLQHAATQLRAPDLAAASQRVQCVHDREVIAACAGDESVRAALHKKHYNYEANQ